jgi:hypothetical protein
VWPRMALARRGSLPADVLLRVISPGLEPRRAVGTSAVLSIAIGILCAAANGIMSHERTLRRETKALAAGATCS